jgi:4-carboxymuconolactone decarboxylase
VATIRDDHRARHLDDRAAPAGGRLRALQRTDLNATQRVFYDSMVANEVPWAEGGGARAIADDGSLLGPFNALLFSPVISTAMLDVFRADKTNTALPKRVHEIVILTVGASCRAAYELYAHRAIGRAVGLADATIDAIVSEGQPRFDSDAETVAHEFTTQLIRTNRVDDVTYATAANEFGETGLVDMIMLIGLYVTVCAIVNVFEVPVP